MPRTTPHLLPRMARLLEQLGERLKLARLRRRYSADVVAERAGISRKTLFRVEQGDPVVALGIYARVLQVLRLEQDLGLVAVDDELGRKLQDLELEPRQRAARTVRPRPVSDDSGETGEAGGERETEAER
jgi:transcriptional regulator with XRE-family HTH domain